MRFSARRNCPRERWGWRRLIGKVFHRRGPATPNARSPRHVRVCGTKHVTGSVVDGDRQRQRVDSRPSSTVGLAHAALWTLAWPAWTELVGGLEASAAAGEQAICGRAVKRRWSDVQRRSGPLEAVASVHRQYHTWDCCSNPGSQNIGWVELSRTLLFNGTNCGVECRFQLVDRHVSIKYT